MAVALTYASGVPVDQGRAHRRASSPSRAPTTHEERDGVEPRGLPRPHRQRRGVRRRGRARPTPSACSPPTTRASRRSTCCAPSPPAASPRSVAGPRLEPGVRRQLRSRASATTMLADEIERALAFMRACGIDLHDEHSAAGRRLLHEPRGARSSTTSRPSRGATRSPATGTTARRTCCGSASAPASSTARTSSSSRASSNPARAASSARPWAPTSCRRLVERAQPRQRVAGRLTFISRMGARARRGAPRARSSRRVRDDGHTVVWDLRPDARQHVHRRRAASKTRRFDDILGRDPAGSSRCTARSGPGPAACTSSSPATRSPSASAAAEATRRGRPRRELHVDLRPAAQRDARASTSPSTSPSYLRRATPRAAARTVVVAQSRHAARR